MKFEEYCQTDDGLNLLSKLKRQLEVRGFGIEEYSDEVLFDEIENAILAVNQRRHYTPTETSFFEEQYRNIIVRLCICSFSKMGAEGQLAHSENGTSRTYAGASEYPSDILKEIVPLARIREI